MSNTYLQFYTTNCLTLTSTYTFLKINPWFFPKTIHLLIKKKILNFWKPCRINSISVLTLYRCNLWFNILDVQTTSITASFNFLLICDVWKHNKNIIQVCCLNLRTWCYQSSSSGAFEKYFCNESGFFVSKINLQIVWYTHLWCNR